MFAAEIALCGVLEHSIMEAIIYWSVLRRVQYADAADADYARCSVVEFVCAIVGADVAHHGREGTDM